MGESILPYPSVKRKGSTRSRSMFSKWRALAIGLGVIVFFLFFLGPKVATLSMVEPLTRVIDEKGIEAGMYFYTDVGVFSEAQLNIKNSMDFPPQQR